MTLQIELDGREHKSLSPDELRAKGYKVRVRHLRYLDSREVYMPKDAAKPLTRRQFRDKIVPVFPRGGLTHVLVLAPDHIWAEATVKCSPQDAFVKRVGYVLAVEKAMKEISQLRRVRSRETNGS